MISEKKLAHLVGAGNTSTKPDDLEKYSRDISFVNAIKPACVIKPRNVDELHKLVELANETNTPLVPVSSGAPHFRGDTVPGTGGAIIVDLSGWKKVMHIDRKNRAVMFEPGVTFGELTEAVAKEGLRLNLPLLPRATKSVVGSLLEREPVIMPKYHWDIADPLACTEIVFGNGEMFRTGAAAGSGTIEEQWQAGGAQKEAAGPSSASWYRMIQGSQGTMGIVTWASARCELLPVLEEPFFIGSSSLEKMLDIAHWLIRLRLVNECLILNNTNMAMITANNKASDYRKKKDGLPPWILFFNIGAYNYLPEERLKGQIEDMRVACQRVGVEAVKTLGAITSDKFLKLIQQSCNEPYWKLRLKGSSQDIFFLTVFDRLGAQIQALHEAADIAGYPVSEIGVYLQPIVQGVNCHCEFNFFYDAENLDERDRVKELSAKATAGLIAKGAFFSRPYGENTGMIMNRDAATVATLKKVKLIVDPNNIMNPGKLCF